MTGVRESFVFALEDEFSTGKGANSSWIAPPVGSFFNSTHSRQATKIYTTGSKFFDTVAYGQLNGSFNWTFVFDYSYLEPLQLAFEKIDCEPNDDGVHYTHTYEKINNARVPSFTVRRKILNRMAGGPDYSDEITELRGCVVRNITFSKAAGTSQLQVTFTGFYADERMYKGELDATDYKEYSGKLSEYMCMFIGDIDKNNYVANTESLEFSLENNSDAIYNTCSPFAGIYYEGRTNCSFGTTCYSNNPSYYKQRVYSGGYKNDVLKPMAKGLRPIQKITLAAYDKSIRDEPYYDTVDYQQAFLDSDQSFKVELTDVVIKSLTWPKGNDQKLQDTISSAECKKIKLTVVNTINDSKVGTGPQVYNANNVVQSYGFGLIFTDPENYPIIPTNSLITILSNGQQVAPTLPTAASSTGGTFKGWWTTAAGTASASAGEQITAGTVITQNYTLYARWQYDVTFNPNGGKIIPPGSTTPGTTNVILKTDIGTSKLTSTEVTALEPTLENCHFDYWSESTETPAEFDTTKTIHKNTTLKAIWVCHVSFNMNGHGTAPETQTVLKGSKATQPSAPEETGYTFKGWYDAATGGNVFDFTTHTINVDTVVYAQWTQNNS